MTFLTSLAKITIILSWLSVSLACVSVACQLIWARMNARRIRLIDSCCFAAFVIAICVVIQITWAIIDEGAGKHQTDLDSRNIAAVAKACSILMNDANHTNTTSLSSSMRYFGQYVTPWCEFLDACSCSVYSDLSGIYPFMFSDQFCVYA